MLVAFRELWANRRRLIFVYDIATLSLLLAVGWLYAKNVWEIQGLIPRSFELFAKGMWLGSLGGITISLKGVYENAGNPPWSNFYNLWHLGRPFSGAATGLITVLIFLVFSQSGQVNRHVVLLAAFILGTQEARFFSFLAEIARIIVQVPPSLKGPGGLRVTSVAPGEGREGVVLLVAGQGFERGAIVKLGSAPLTNAVVAADGNSVAGAVPNLGGATRTVDITVLNPGGNSAVLPDRFKFIV